MRLLPFLKDRRGNVTILFAVSAVPILFALGAAADYGFAVKTRAKMNAAADAAALAAVTPQLMSQPTTTAQTAAINMFNAQVSTLARLSYNPANLTVTVNDAIAGGQRTRKAVVTYTAASITAFAGIINKSTIAIGGTSTANASTSPNINFYLMLDTSPSMAIPATSTGINWLVANTPAQGGCAFACHEKNPAADNLGNPNGEDNYALAKNASPPLILRMDLVTQAVVNLISSAQSTAASTGAAYQLAAYTFDAAVNLPMPLQAPSQAAQTQAQQIQLLEVDSNNVLNGVNNNDEDTNFDAAFTRLNTDMTNAGAGTGTNNPGDKPQQVLMTVTDGVSDESWNNARSYLPLGGTTNLSAAQTDWCTQIKSNPDVRIAILYLTYNPQPMTSTSGQPTWYATYVAPEQQDILPTMQNCASPGLFFQVNTDGDVTAAMNTLFLAAVQGAHLSN